MGQMNRIHYKKNCGKHRLLRYWPAVILISLCLRASLSFAAEPPNRANCGEAFGASGRRAGAPESATFVLRDLRHSDGRTITIAPAVPVDGQFRNPFSGAFFTAAELDFLFVIHLLGDLREALSRDFARVPVEIAAGKDRAQALSDFHTSLTAGNLWQGIANTLAIFAYFAAGQDQPQQYFSGLTHRIGNIFNRYSTTKALTGFLGNPTAFDTNLARYLSIVDVRRVSTILSNTKTSVDSMARVNPRNTATRFTITINPSTGGKPNDFTLDLPPTQIESLRGILEELFWNAAKYGDGSDIFVNYSEATKTFAISNSGSGIPDDVDPFASGYRGEHGDIPGTGNGLGGIREEARVHGWTLALSSRRNPTTFTLSLGN
jgi:signal transduction histidine kinase